MGKGCEKMKEASKDLFHWIYPGSIDLPECVLRMLERIYPTVDWDTVTFHDGIPWIFRLGSENAITLPGTYDLHHINIYFKPGQWDPCACHGLSTIVHESFHVLQYRDLADGWGLGFLRGFMIAYLSCSVTGGGAQGNPIEDPAYAQDALFEQGCNNLTAGRICDCSSNPPAFGQAALDELITNNPDLVRNSSGIDFWKITWNCTPGNSWLTEKAGELISKGCAWTWHSDGSEINSFKEGKQPESLVRAVGDWFLKCPASVFGAGIVYLVAAIWYAIWTLVWTVITVIIAILKPILEAILLIVDGVLWIVTGIVCAAEWLWDKIVRAWNWFKEQLNKVCNWAGGLEQGCSEWEITRESECTEERDEGHHKCAREEDRGYNKCAREEDRGYNKCTQTRDEGYSRCCDWWPCSWACDAWVWVSNIVCVAWTWISNVVCVAWTWVSNIVCVAWTWISNVVCVAWTWVVSKTCKAFTWVIKKGTCW